jgi:DNA invertase Pin-like site-specific DNA recombinase
VSWHSDEGISGSKGLEARDGLADALNALAENSVQGIVVYRLDRLARDLVLQEQLLAEIKRLKGTPFSASPAEAHYLTDDPEDPSRKLIRQILGAVNEYERSIIALRLSRGRRLKSERGGYAGGAPGFGLKAAAGELVPNETERATVARIVELHRSGLGSREIALRLNAAGRVAKRGGAWSSAQVCRVVRSVGPPCTQ